MKMHLLIVFALLACSAPAAAERLQFDYRLYPPLQTVLNSGDKGMVDFNAADPRRLVDLIAVKGTSANDWSEALEIVSIARPRKLPDARAWMKVLQEQALARCKAEFAIIAEDATSITFERQSVAGCTAEPANTGIYRLVAGKRSWFQLAVLSKGAMSEASRQQWLTLLASAHLD